MNILIPMAGRGKRFKDEGFERPKPFIMVNGKPMIEYVVSNLDILNRFDYQLYSSIKLIFLCLKEFIDEYGAEFSDRISKYHSNFVIIKVHKVTEGAACTALLAKDLINNNDELIIGDCDHAALDAGWFNDGIKFFRKNYCNGGIWCFLADHPKWSYSRIKDGNVIEVAEKRVISDLANTGTYYFKRGKDFVRAAETMIQRNDRTMGEFYTLPTYSYLIADGFKIKPYLVNEHVALGTPNDLRIFQTMNKIRGVELE